MKFSPASTKASSILNDVASSAVQPNTLPPSIRGATSIADFPSWRFFIVEISASILLVRTEFTSPIEDDGQPRNHQALVILSKSERLGSEDASKDPCTLSG